MAKVFTYTKYPVSIDILSLEIRNSAIVTALDNINLFGNNLDIFFKSDLSEGDKVILDSVVANHTGQVGDPEITKVMPMTEQAFDFMPVPRAFNIGTHPQRTDKVGNLVTRGQVLTDEGSFRDNFFGSSLFTTLQGSFDFSPESDVVLFKDSDLTQMKFMYPYVKSIDDPDTAFTQGFLDAYNTFSLSELYKGGAHSSGTAIISNWFPVISDNISVTVVDSLLKISSSQSDTYCCLSKSLDFLPVRVSFKFNLSKHIKAHRFL
jgi:hypothetical protein